MGSDEDGLAKGPGGELEGWCRPDVDATVPGRGLSEAEGPAGGVFPASTSCEQQTAAPAARWPGRKHQSRPL